MKKTGIILLVMAIICQAFTQEKTDTKQEEKQKGEKAEMSDNTKIIIGRNLITFEDSDSAVKIRVGNRGLSIFESLEGSKVNFEKYERLEKIEDNEYDYYDQNDSERRIRNRARNFRGHWAGFEFGLNNFVYERSMDLPADISYMSLITSKSNCININFSQLSMGLTRHMGIVTGIGLNWNIYRFEGNNSITIGADNIISELVPEGDVILKKSKFSTFYLNVPALLELQLPAGYGHRLNIAAGVIGGIKLNARTKMVFEDREKLKTNGDFNLNLFRGGVTARAGYQNFMLYGTYYLTPWFRENKGPNGYNLEPFEIGIAFTFND